MCCKLFSKFFKNSFKVYWYINRNNNNSFEFWKVFIVNYISIGNIGYMFNVSYII